MSFPSRAVASCIFFIVASSCGFAAAADGLSAAIGGGTTNFDLRLRSEHVRQQNALRDAHALTARARLGYTTAAWQGLEAALEYSATGDLGGSGFNSLRNGEADRSVVADPEGARVNQALLRYRGLLWVEATAGRQRLILDNARFIGNVGMRQNEQTFDAVRLRATPLTQTTLTYAYLHRVNGIALRSTRMTGHLVNARHAPLPQFVFSAYGYWLDFDEVAALPRDRRTLGARVTGEITAGTEFSYALEYARQAEHGDSSGVGANYWLAELKGDAGPLKLGIGYEVLGGDGEQAFQTPLATLHAFQGWADVFLTTPSDGVRDLHLSVAGTLAGNRLTAVWHHFSADSGGADYGREWDLQLSRSLGNGVVLSLKFADYRAREFAVDTRKLWLVSEYRF